ncbi:MAG: polysaccharide deacetylase family protein [Clostridiales bacterium]|nr:polysaccharide deacetylase family protein [Clostridiales bacterium]
MKILCVKMKTFFKMLSLSLIAIVMATVVFITNSGTIYFGYASRLVPIYSVDTREKKVALTFDAAWGSDKTLKIVKTLEDAGVKGTFFLVGFWIEQNKDKVKAIDEAGFDIGTHSNTHPKMSTLSQAKMKEELETSMNMITNITGKPVRFFRAPFGDYNDTLLTVAGSLGLKTIQWDVDSLDWKGLSANEILSRVKASVKNGSIILCHNNSDHILEALPLVISYLKTEGYSIVKISQLAYDDNYIIDNNGLQKLK